MSCGEGEEEGRRGRGGEKRTNTDICGYYCACKAEGHLEGEKNTNKESNQANVKEGT